jgi:hypothetical protein
LPSEFRLFFAYAAIGSGTCRASFDDATKPTGTHDVWVHTALLVAKVKGMAYGRGAGLVAPGSCDETAPNPGPDGKRLFDELMRRLAEPKDGSKENPALRRIKSRRPVIR